MQLGFYISRAEWISKSVYGAAIVSFSERVSRYIRTFLRTRKYPYEGRWELTIRSLDDNKNIANHTVAISYSESAGTYWGYSNIHLGNPSEPAQVVWVEVVEFSSDEKKITLRLISKDESTSMITQTLKIERNGQLSIKICEYPAK